LTETDKLKLPLIHRQCANPFVEASLSEGGGAKRRRVPAATSPNE